jgi:4a-hydroxytetrahydrobiopterin dehydratase
MMKLTSAEIEAALAGLPGWEHLAGEGRIRRRWEFADFDAAMDFVGLVADIARRLDHHPDLYNVYNRVELSLTTHDADGLTARDMEFARSVDALPAAG